MHNDRFWLLETEKYTMDSLHRDQWCLSSQYCCIMNVIEKVVDIIVLQMWKTSASAKSAGMYCKEMHWLTGGIMLLGNIKFQQLKRRVEAVETGWLMDSSKKNIQENCYNDSVHSDLVSNFQPVWCSCTLWIATWRSMKVWWKVATPYVWS